MGDGQLTLEAFAARFEIDRCRKAIGLLVELCAGRELVDECVQRPAILVEPRGLRGERLRRQLSVTLCAGCVWRTAPVTVEIAVVAATAGRATAVATWAAAVPSGFAATLTSTAFTAADTLLNADISCALALDAAASITNPITADAPRLPNNLITIRVALLRRTAAGGA